MEYYRIPTQLLSENLIINLHKDYPKGSYNLKKMREKQRTSKGKFIKKSELLKGKLKNLPWETPSLVSKAMKLNSM